MKHEAGVRERGRGITDSVMTGFISMGAEHDRCLRSCRPWGMALVLLVVAACGGGGGSGSSNSSNDTDDTATVESVSLDRETLLLETGDSASITATLHLSNGETASRSSNVNWFLENSGVADIAGEGTVVDLEGLSPGQTTITAESGGHSATADVFVSKSVALQVRPTAVYLPPQCSEPVTARLITGEGITQDVTRDVAWSVSNSDAITVANGDPEGGFVAAKKPSATPVASVVSASHRGRRATGRVTVADLTSIALFNAGNNTDVTGGAIDLAQDEPRQLRAVGAFEQDVEFPELPARDVTDCVDWNSQSESVATVTNEGVVTGVAPGSSQITASYTGDPSANVSVIVEDHMTGFFIDREGSVDLTQGATKGLSARATIDDGTETDITIAVDWRSDDPGVVTVSNETGTEGRVTGVAPGQAVVTAALSGFNDDSVTVNVTSDPDEPGELSVSADPNVVLAGDSNDLSVICTYLISNDLDDLIADTGITFSIVEGKGRADLDPETVSTDESGQAACTDLVPKDGSEPGSVIVRAEESDSGLAETVDVELVSSYATVFDTNGEVDPLHSDDGTASSGSVFEATLVNGSNREFAVDAETLAFCDEDGAIDVEAQDVEDDQVSGGGQIVVSVTTGEERTSTGFAIALRLSDENTGETFPVDHQFTDTDVTCEPDEPE